MEFTGSERLQLISLLPQEAGSLREATQIKRLRDTLQLTDEEQEEIELEQQTGSFNPQALQELDKVEIEMSQQKRRVIAYVFVQKEDEGNVPTSDAFISLAEKFADAIAEAKSELEGQKDNE